MCANAAEEQPQHPQVSMAQQFEVVWTGFEGRQDTMVEL